MNEQPEVKTKALVVLSGGQDSATCLYWAKQNYHDVHAITFNYGQRHKIEIESAKMVAKLAGVESHEILDLPAGILAGTSPLVDKTEAVPEYSTEEEMPDGVAKTFVPMRNQFFLTIAANRAFVLGCNVLVTGVCETDYSGYPDCRRDFIDSFEDTCNLGTFTGEDWLEGKLQVETPLMHMTKAQSVDLAIEIGAWPALAYSHTAYDGTFPPVGTDAASILRANGFLEAEVCDPMILRAWKLGLCELPQTSNYTSEEVNVALNALETSLGENWYALSID